MSATALDRSPKSVTAAARPVAVRSVTLRRAIVSEWIKLRSLRSTVITLAVSLLLVAGVGVLVGAVTANQWTHLQAADKAGFDPTTTALRGFLFGQLAVGVLGVLTVSSEYATGMIRSTLAAVPKRLPALWAKCLLFGAITLVMVTIASFIAFFGTQAALSSRQLQTSISAPGVLRAVVGCGLYLTVVGLLGLALGALMRNTAAAITTLFGVLLLLPLVFEFLPSSIKDHTYPYLPSNAGQAILSVHQQPGMLAPWTGFAVMCGYAVAALAAAALLLKRRDA